MIPISVYTNFSSEKNYVFKFSKISDADAYSELARVIYT